MKPLLCSLLLLSQKLPSHPAKERSGSQKIKEERNGCGVHGPSPFMRWPELLHIAILSLGLVTQNVVCLVFISPSPGSLLGFSAINTCFGTTDKL